MKSCVFRRLRCATLACVTSVLVSTPALADTAPEDVVAPAGGKDQDPPTSHTRFLAPAFIATSSTEPFVSVNVQASARTGNAPPFAGEASDPLRVYGITTSPQFGFHLPGPSSIFDNFLLYMGADGTLSAGGNIGSLLGDGAVFSGDVLAGAVVHIRRDNWRIGLNGRFLYGGGDAIEAANLVTGINENFTNQSFTTAISELKSGIGALLLPYTLTAGRLDLVAAYGFEGLTFQGAAGFESTTETFHPSALPFQVQAYNIFAAPRLGFAVGVDPGFLAKRPFPVEFLAEYQMTVNQTHVDITQAPPPPAPVRITESLVALGFYSSRTVRRDLQLGLSLYGRFGVPESLLATGEQTLETGRPIEWGALTMMRYLF
jgi:hypothetical protein